MKVQQVIGLRILVEPAKEETIETKGAILVVEDKAMRPRYGKVFMVGGKVNADLKAEGEPEIVAGDTIAYDRTQYPTMQVEGVEYELIQKLNLIGVCG